MELIGKMYMSAVCPLCSFTYLLEKSDFQYINQKIQDSHVDEKLNFYPAIYEEKIQFYCSECGKTMKSNRYCLVNYTDEFVKQLASEMRTNKK